MVSPTGMGTVDGDDADISALFERQIWLERR